MLRSALVCVVAMLLMTASPALGADPRTQILRECQDGALTGHYTARQIRDARDHIPTDIDQYSDCRGVLSRALARLTGAGDGGGTSGGGGTGGGGTSGGGGGAGGGGGGSGTGGAGSAGTGGGGLLTPATPADQQALAGARGGGAAPVEVGGAPVTPGAAGLEALAPRNPLPVALVVVLALLALAALAGVLALLRDRAGALRVDRIVVLGRRVLARGR